ncbi:MAG: efflux RND transporter periplasmic adaptor subunit [Gemmatimonadales bacterium]
MTRFQTLLLATLCFAPSACKGKPAQAEGDKPGADSGIAATGGGASLALPVAGESVRRGDLVLTVATTGQVRSDAVATLKGETSGTVDDVLVRPGSRVHKGDPIARLDPRPLDLAVREAEANLAEAEIKYKGSLASDSILLGPAQEADRLKNAMALSGMPRAQVQLEKARLDRERATITAPFDGIIDRVSIAAGERLSAGQEVATVVDVTHLRVEAQVLEHDLPFVHPGGEALISTPATAGSPVHGRIAAVLPLVDSTSRAGRVVVSVNASGKGAVLQPGMYADLRLEASRLPNRVIVPAKAVIERDGRPLVFVVKNGRAQWVYILPGRSNGAETEVLPDSASGQIPVTVGDTVLTEGHLTLTHDAPVRVLSAKEQSRD